MNIANKLTILRIILIPIFMIFLVFDIEYGQFIAAAIFVVASITDYLDGYLARTMNLVTKFGKFIDPLADKLLVSTAFITLTEMGKIPSWIAVLIIAREFVITGLRVLAASEGITIAASWWGKLKTISQMIAITLLLIDNFPFYLINFPLDQITLALAVIFTLISGFDYIYKNKNVFKINN